MCPHLVFFFFYICSYWNKMTLKAFSWHCYPEWLQIKVNWFKYFIVIDCEDKKGHNMYTEALKSILLIWTFSLAEKSFSIKTSGWQNCPKSLLPSLSIKVKTKMKLKMSPSLVIRVGCHLKFFSTGNSKLPEFQYQYQNNTRADILLRWVCVFI